MLCFEYAISCFKVNVVYMLRFLVDTKTLVRVGTGLPKLYKKNSIQKKFKIQLEENIFFRTKSRSGVHKMASWMLRDCSRSYISLCNERTHKFSAASSCHSLQITASWRETPTGAELWILLPIVQIEGNCVCVLNVLKLHSFCMWVG